MLTSAMRIFLLGAICCHHLLWPEESLGQNQASVTIHYGTVSGVSQVRIETDVRPSTAWGGIAGLARKPGGRRTKGALKGTAIAKAVTPTVTQKATVMEYTVTLVSGETTRMIIGHRRFRIGDCVAVERARSNNLRRVSSVHCEERDRQPTADHTEEAIECVSAKDMVEAATTEEELVRAIKIARIVCED